MIIAVHRVRESSAELREAVGRLLPQLAASLGTPSNGSIERLIGNDHAALFAAMRASQVVGMLTLSWCDLLSGGKAWIEDVVVDSDHRGEGIGEALVRAAVDHAVHVGAERVMLTSNPSREAARALYRKIGFKEAETSVFAFKID